MIVSFAYGKSFDNVISSESDAVEKCEIVLTNYWNHQKIYSLLN